MARHPHDEQAPARPPTGGVILLGWLAITLFFGGFMTWAALAPLVSAAIAPGQVTVESNRKTIQHLEGGIVQAIHVREGAKVEAGEVLVEFDRTKAHSKLTLLRAQLEADEKQLRLVSEEVAVVRELLEQGNAIRPRLLALLRRAAELEGSRAKLMAQIVDAEDTLSRASVRATTAGTVVGLQIHTEGGVVQPGSPLMDIVPKDERLVIEARVEPIDIDVVHPGLKALVYLTPFGQRGVQPISGTVVNVSADQFTDERSRVSYYLARIVLTEAPTDLVGGGELYPGMPAEVMIVTGQRTFLQSLWLPVRQSFNRAMRES